MLVHNRSASVNWGAGTGRWLRYGETEFSEGWVVGSSCFDSEFLGFAEGASAEIAGK